jgi:hypothetical protein
MLKGGFFMNIYVSPDLAQLKDELKKKGYNLIEEERESCDAIICNLKECNISSFNTSCSLKREGTLIIDCGSKNIDDIDYILNNRSYSSLF